MNFSPSPCLIHAPAETAATDERGRSGLLRVFFLPCLFFLAGLSACAGTNALLPTPGEEQAATTATLTWLRSRNGMVRNPDLDRLLERITARLSESPASGSSPTWHVYVLNDWNPNAFSLGRATIVLTKGMIAETRTEAELAAVIAHEMSHQLLGHTRKALMQAKENNTGARPTGSFSPEDETAADSFSLKLLHHGRYRLEAALGAVAIGYHQGNYRQTGANVTSPGQAWLAYRMANLHQELAQYPPGLPATESSREFNRVRHALLGTRR